MIPNDPKEFNRLLSAIKRCFSRSSYRKQALDAAVSRKKGPRGGKLYKCSGCKKLFGSREVQVDHTVPIVPTDKKALDIQWNILISRIYCDIKNLQVLCKACHKKKNRVEAAERKEYRAASKKET